MRSINYSYAFKDEKETTSLDVVNAKIQLVQEYVKTYYLEQEGPCFSQNIENNPYIWIKYGVDKKGLYAEFGNHSSTHGKYYFGLYPEDKESWTGDRCGARVGEFILLNWSEIKQFLNDSLSKKNEAQEKISNFAI